MAEENQDSGVRQEDGTRQIVVLRVFAFFLIDAAQESCARLEKGSEPRLRALKVGLKACRFCLDKGDLDIALKVLERCAEYVSVNNEKSPLVRIVGNEDGGDERAARRDLTSEFYLLRVTHAWKSGRLDLAEHFLSKLSVSGIAGSSQLSHKAANTFWEAGKSLSKGKSTESALRWLDRALDALNAVDLDRTNNDAKELRLAITSTLGESYIAKAGRNCPI